MTAPRTTRDDFEINVHEPAEILRLSEELGVTELDLRDAIHDVGPRMSDVKRALAELVIPNHDRYYDDMPAEEGGQVWERETAPGPRPEQGQ
jgi:hypothetical protein